MELVNHEIKLLFWIRDCRLGDWAGPLGGRTMVILQFAGSHWRNILRWYRTYLLFELFIVHSMFSPNKNKLDIELDILW